MPFLIGKRVSLQPLSQDDVPLLVQWANNPSSRQMTRNTFPRTFEGTKKQAEEVSTANPKNDIVWMTIWHNGDKKVIGEAKPPDPFYKALFTAWGDGSGLKKIIASAGLEYWYGSPRLIALRIGYFHEDENYGNRKFLTYGAGIRYDIYGFDFSYISASDAPLSDTIRFSLLISWGGAE